MHVEYTGRPAKDLPFGSSSAKRRRREATRSPLRLVLVGFTLEAVYIVGFVRPYGLVAWLPSPIHDVGTMSGVSSESGAAFLASVVAIIVGSCIAYREACRLPPRLAAGDTPTSAPR